MRSSVSAKNYHNLGGLRTYASIVQQFTDQNVQLFRLSLLKVLQPFSHVGQFDGADVDINQFGYRRRFNWRHLVSYNSMQEGKCDFRKIFLSLNFRKATGDWYASGEDRGSLAD